MAQWGDAYISGEVIIVITARRNGSRDEIKNANQGHGSLAQQTSLWRWED